MDNLSQLTKVFLADSLEGLERMERCLTELESRPEDSSLVAEIFRTVHTIKGGTGFLGFHRLEALAHAGEQTLGALREREIAVTPALVGALLTLHDTLRAILQLIERTGGEGIRSTDDDSGLIAALLREHRPSAAPLEPRPAPAAVPSTTAEKTLRIDVEVLNRMMNLVGELVLTRNRILRSSPGAPNFGDLASRLNTVTADLRETVMAARMQPVGSVFSRFTRMVRDLGQTCGRSVRIEFEGQETGLDKSLLEAIKDPLTHAVRNAVDHGIESPETRLAVGKPAQGLVRLRASHQNGFVVIEVIDDGAGIAKERVLAKAIERGLVDEDRAGSLSEREVMRFIFTPGFSTAEEVTHISGRGIGMDVVRANVESIGGSVEIDSTPGLGTTLRLRVPLTLAIVPALVVRSGGDTFALPQSPLRELVYMRQAEAADALQRIGTAEYYRLRDRTLPLVRLDRLLGLEAQTAQLPGFYIAVLETEGCRFALILDDLLAPEEIVVKPVSRVLREIGLFSGATVLGNGALAMVLDAAALAARAGVRYVAEDPPSLPAEAAKDLAQAAAGAMVLYELANRESTAIPLNAVERIESVPIDHIEHAGGRLLLQYRGELVPLEDGGNAVQAPNAAGGMATILICRRQGPRGPYRVGVIVQTVLDISDGTLLAPANWPAARPQDRFALVNDRVAALNHNFDAEFLAAFPAIPADALELQEVA